jgi:hypothetical protein
MEGARCFLHVFGTMSADMKPTEFELWLTYLTVGIEEAVIEV